MKALPWILVLVFLAVAGFLFTQSKKTETESMRLRQENVELQQWQDAQKGAKESETENTGSLAEKEKQELIRLRNEVGQLKRDKQKLSAQVQQSQQNSDRLLQTQQAQQAQQQQLQQQNQQLALQTQQAQIDKALNACINNLRQIDGAKQQWALENKQPATALVLPQHIAPYLRNQAVPVCPSSGVYILGNVQSAPTCSIPGHALPQ
ncbi:MAG: hypothetical protein ABIR24_04260 [Verrucomicrobiota bacterium]